VAHDQAAGVPALGVVFGGSGNGEQIAANKVEGIRAALVWSISTAELARQHNDANVISIGARQHTLDEAIAFIDAFIAEPFSQDERHVRRIAQLGEYETTGDIAGKGVDKY
jgi:ribose 5-phosphate isomerase B